MTPALTMRGLMTLGTGGEAIDDCLDAQASGSPRLKEVVMETFTLDLRCWRIGYIFGRNPLLRRADRIEALVTLAALVVALVAIPVVGVVGAMSYDARERIYVQEARERHAIVATVAYTGIDGAGRTYVQARWPVAAGERTGSLEPGTAAKVGDRTEIWVDKDGNLVDPPTPTWHAVGDAVAAAEATLLMVGIAITSLVAGVRSRLDRARDAQWEREIRCLQEDGGRTNQH
jgi:hypothetical protein